jgi:hypothetical protein
MNYDQELRNLRHEEAMIEEMQRDQYMKQQAEQEAMEQYFLENQ